MRRSRLRWSRVEVRLPGPQAILAATASGGALQDSESCSQKAAELCSRFSAAAAQSSAAIHFKLLEALLRYLLIETHCSSGGIWEIRDKPSLDQGCA